MNWFDALSRALSTLFLAPFVALAALFGLIIIAIGYWLLSVEIFLQLFGADVNLGSEFVIDAGISQLPEFFY